VRQRRVFDFDYVCMTDALRSDSSSAPGDTPDRERDARIEELLLTGLDHYFGGQHELAINVWTRVLFLDRGHAKARAYIERARGAIAERQREADELLHSGAEALQRGDRAAARELLTSAVERGVSGEEALALLHRLDRLEAAGTLVRRVPSSRQPATDRRVARRAAPRRDSRIVWVAAGIVTGILIAVAVGGYLWMVADPLEIGTSQNVLPPQPQDPLPVPSASEILLTRARDLFEKGRIREALALLDRAEPDDRHRASFDALRATIQRDLLEAGRKAAALGSADPSSRSVR
jgi:tetratricopeptide (TPR) repeat protein